MSENLFVTKLYKGRIAPPRDLEKTCLAIAAEDKAGQRWAKSHGYGGYTSYASLNDLTRRASIFADLERAIARQVAGFARELQFELGGRKLKLDSLWINVMKKGAVHTPHIHPHSAISGTYYVTAPPGSGAIRFEDPRLGLMMAAPPPKKRPPGKPQLCGRDAQTRHAAVMGKLAAPWRRAQRRQDAAHIGELQLPGRLDVMVCV